MKQGNLTILIADDHDVVRRGVRALLESERGWRVVAEASDGHEAVRLAKRHQPAIAVVDITMPKLNGLQVTRELAQVSPHTRVLVLTVHDSEQVVREATAAGARGCVLKADAGRQLVAAVGALSRGEAFVTPRVAELLMEGPGPAVPPATQGAAPRGELSQDLTPREREVVQLVANGRSGRDIAEALGISLKTVEAHRANVLRKLGLRNTAGLVRYAVRNRLVDA